MGVNGRVTAKDIIALLYERYCQPEWAFFPELRVGTGYANYYGRHSKDVLRGKVEQRLDAWAMNCWPSKRLVKLAFEIKISRGDFIHELKRPEKREAAFLVSNQYYFVAPYTIIAVNELPKDCGLIIVTKSGQLRIIQEALYRDVQPSWTFFAALARRVAEMEKK